MAEKYLRLPDGKKIEFYKCTITNGCILRFLNTTIDTVKDFLGSGIIDYIDILDESEKLVKTHQLSMKRKTILSETTTIVEYEERIVQEAYTDEDGDHEAIVENVEKQIPVEMITAILEKPSVSEELDTVKTAVGIVNTNNMTLDEFKDYYKGQIGKECTSAIENGVDVETTLGKKHFSYTIEDQSNVKDLMMTALLTDFSLPLPYHADGELCNTYEPSDLLSIYMSLSSNKTYHTTYCNVLNAMINEAKDLISVKAITYGMEITDEKYLDVMSKIDESKDALLAYVEKKFSEAKSE